MPSSTSTPFLTSKDSYDSLQKPFGKPARSFWTWATISRLQLELLLSIPPLCFLVFAGLTVRHSGKHVDEYPISHLQKATTYGPTVFPIIFAAIAGNFFKAVASWRLEARRGISVLNLEYLLSSRTVFSTVTTPFNLRRITLMTPFIISIWILSPLGGQAASRVLTIVPSTTVTDVPFQYFGVHEVKDVNLIETDKKRINDFSQVLYDLFHAALFSPGKTEPQDIFGHPRIPMIETCEDPGSGQGHYINTENRCRYSSLFGIPIKGATPYHNSTVRLETSYVYSDCKVVQRTWSTSDLLNVTLLEDANWNTPNRSSWNELEIYESNIMVNMPTNGSTPLTNRMIFMTYDLDNMQTTNASCTLTMKDVEADVVCYGKKCVTKRIRYSERPAKESMSGLFERYWPANPGDMASTFWWHFTYSVGRSVNLAKTFPYIENYIMTPDSSDYSVDQGNIGSNRPVATDDETYSQRVTQLMNTFWVAMHASTALTGNFTSYYTPGPVDGVWKEEDVHKFDPTSPLRTIAMSTLMQRQSVRNVTGTQTPDRLEMHYVLGWVVVLVISSTVMLLAGIASAVLGTLRQGPDLLDRTGVMLRDNVYVRIDDMYASSVEDGFDQARRLRNERLCIGDVKDKANDDVGYIALGTTNAVTPMRRVPKGRLYK